MFHCGIIDYMALENKERALATCLVTASHKVRDNETSQNRTIEIDNDKDKQANMHKCKAKQGQIMEWWPCGYNNKNLITKLTENSM